MLDLLPAFLMSQLSSRNQANAKNGEAQQLSNFNFSEFERPRGFSIQQLIRATSFGWGWLRTIAVAPATVAPL
jgi:hypothetical protein